MSVGASKLWERIEEAGLPDIYNLLGEGNVRPYDWEKMAGVLPEKPQALWRFLMLGAPLPAARAADLLGEEALGFLRAHGLSREVTGEFTLGSLALFSFRGTRFFAERQPLSRAYFSDDQRALMTLVPQRRQSACLCLYPGSGAPLLPLASQPGLKTSFALGPLNRGLIRANLDLNGAETPPRFLAADAPLDHGPYDLIAASPPCGLEVAGGRLPAWLRGGRDGRRCLLEVLELAARGLAPQGTLALTFLFFSGANSKVMEQQLRDLLAASPLAWRLTVCSKHFLEPGSPVFNSLINAAIGGKARGTEPILKSLLRHLRRRKLEAVYLIKGRFFRAPPPRGELLDYSDLYYGAWVF